VLFGYGVSDEIIYFQYLSGNGSVNYFDLETS
jgi:hypothetical protein